MALSDMLAGLTPAEKVALLERVKRKMIALHNTKASTLSLTEFEAWKTTTFFPKMNRVSMAIAAAREVLGAATTYDSRIDLDGI